MMDTMDLAQPPSKKPRLQDLKPVVSVDSETPIDDADDLYDTPPQVSSPAVLPEDSVPSRHIAGTGPDQALVPTIPASIPGLLLLGSDNDLASPPALGKSTARIQAEATTSTTAAAEPEPADTQAMALTPPPTNSKADNLITNHNPTSAPEDGASSLMIAEESGNSQALTKDWVSEALPTEKPQDAELPTENVGSDSKPADAEWEIDSSNPDESSSSDSDSSEDSSEEEDYELLSPEEQARILMQGEGGSDDEGAKSGKSGAASHLRTKNEVSEVKVEKPKVTVTLEMPIKGLGRVEAIVENQALVKADTSGERQVLESGSVLCLEDRTVIGSIWETLGRVQQPLYSVLFNSQDEIREAGIEVGTFIFYVEQYSTSVFTSTLKAMKGSDASNIHDEEVAEEEMEFSDDEAEAEFKRKLKQERQAKKDARLGPRTDRAHHPSQYPANNDLDYDDNAAGRGQAHDVDDELYTPLARPTNFQELLGSREAPMEARSVRGHGERGNRSNRGRDRGRGGRGSRGGRGGREGRPDHYDMDRRSNDWQHSRPHPGQGSPYLDPAERAQMSHDPAARPHLNPVNIQRPQFQMSQPPSVYGNPDGRHGSHQHAEPERKSADSHMGSANGSYPAYSPVDRDSRQWSPPDYPRPGFNPMSGSSNISPVDYQYSSVSNTAGNVNTAQSRPPQDARQYWDSAPIDPPAWPVNQQFNTSPPPPYRGSWSPGPQGAQFQLPASLPSSMLQQSPISPGNPLPPGAFVNPAFFRGSPEIPAAASWALHPQGTPSQVALGSGGTPGSPESDAAFRLAQEKLEILRGLSGRRSGSS